MRRREVLKAAVGIGALGATALAAAGEPNPAVQHEVDVLVVGGGTAGSIAAIQAGRAGARTLLLEMGSQLGGTTTAGGVSFPGLFHAWGKQIIAGIGWELVAKAVELDGGVLPDFAVPPKPREHWRHQVQLNGPLYAAILEEACFAAGVALCYYEFPLAVAAAADGWRVEAVGKGTRRTIAAKQLIDCTGGADIVGMVGLPRFREESVQPGTLRFVLAGYDVQQLDQSAIQQRYRQAIAKGQLKPGDHAAARGNFVGFLAAHGENAQHVPGADSSTSATKTQANVDGRRSLLRLLRFIRTLPGCEKTRVVSMASETAVRETYRIGGELQVTHQDYITGRMFDDAVAYSFYPIDLHDQHGVEPKPLKAGIVPTIPLRALVPLGSRNLLVAGRSISSDRLANSALRVQASCMAMGQAAGAAAALAAGAGLTPLTVPLPKLHKLLRQHKAIVPG